MVDITTVDNPAIKHVLEKSLNLHRRAKQTKKDADDAIAISQTTAVEAMHALEVKRYSYLHEGEDVTAVLVEPERSVVDEELLRELVSDETWDSITTTKVVVDMTKVDAAIASGDLDLKVLERVVHYERSKPYIRQTARSANSPLGDPNE